jgi:hypothetical protein
MEPARSAGMTTQKYLADCLKGLAEEAVHRMIEKIYPTGEGFDAVANSLGARKMLLRP